MKFNYVIPFSFYEQTNEFVKQRRAGGFGGNAYSIYVKLKPGITYEQVAPKIRNITKAILIPKPGKANYDNPKSYRPISLTSFLMKGLERIIL